MSWDTVSIRLKQILERIDGVFNVHRYFRDIPDEAKFEEAFTVDIDGKTLLTGWMFTRKAVPTDRPTLDATAVLDATYKVEIQGIMALSDEDQSELLFQRAIDGVLSKFKSKYLLEDESGTSLSGILKTDEINVEEIGHAQFSNTFVHYCRISLNVTERL